MVVTKVVYVIYMFMAAVQSSQIDVLTWREMTLSQYL